MCCIILSQYIWNTALELCLYKKGPSSKLRHIKLFISNFDTLHVEHTILVLQKGQESDNGVVCIQRFWSGSQQWQN